MSKFAIADYHNTQFQLSVEKREAGVVFQHRWTTPDGVARETRTLTLPFSIARGLLEKLHETRLQGRLLDYVDPDSAPPCELCCDGHDSGISIISVPEEMENSALTVDLTLAGTALLAEFLSESLATTPAPMPAKVAQKARFGL